MKRLDFEGNKGTVFYIFLGIFLAFAVNQGLALALSTDMPVVAVESNSMIPAFHKGDILLISGISDKSRYGEFISVGDIIVFSVEERNTPIVHRVVEINPDGTFQTRGDANRGQQLPFEKHIEPGQIHGKVVFILPFLGWVKIGLTEYILPNIYAMLVLTVGVAFLYLTVKKYR